MGSQAVSHKLYGTENNRDGHNEGIVWT